MSDFKRDELTEQGKMYDVRNSTTARAQHVRTTHRQTRHARTIK
jgi:hypothetical protein